MLRRGKMATLDQLYKGVAAVPLRASDKKLQFIASAAHFNVLTLSSQVARKLIVIGGPPGVGKTRLGYEALAMAMDSSGRLMNHLQAATGSPLLVVPVYLDMSNGLKVERPLDLAPGVTTSERLGAWVAAAVLSLPMIEVRRLNGGNLLGLAINNVLDAIVCGVVAERRARRIAAISVNEDSNLQGMPIVLFAVHMDEYQLFTKELADNDGWNQESAVNEVRSMLSLMKNYVLNRRAHLPARPTLLPVVSGTPYDGLHILWTKMLNPRFLLPAVLDPEQALGLFTDFLTQEEPFVGHAQLIRGSMQCLAARVALTDVDLRPRLVMELAQELLLRTPRDLSAQEALSAVDWPALTTAVSGSVTAPISEPAGRLLTQLSLFRIPINFVASSMDKLSPFETVVRDSEAVGHLRLGRVSMSSAMDSYRTVRLPFVQLRRWGLHKLLPQRLLDLPVRPWTADDFEDLVAHYLCARVNFFAAAFGQPVPLAFVLPGALGSPAARGVCVSLHGSRSVYREQFQWLHKKTDQPVKAMTMSAVTDDLTLRASLAVIPDQAVPGGGGKHDEDYFANWEEDVDGPDVDDFLSGRWADDVLTPELQKPEEPDEGAVGKINIKVPEQHFTACDLSTGVFVACRNNALLDVRLALPLSDQHRSCGTTNELHIALAKDAQAAQYPSVPRPATTSSAGPHLHLYCQVKQTQAEVDATQDVISTWYTEARAATAKWRTDGDRTMFVFFTNRDLRLSPESFFTERKDLLIVSRGQLGQALSPAFARRALVSER